MKLISDSEFIPLSAQMKEHIESIHSKTNQLKEKLDSLSSVWKGDDATSVMNAFNTCYPYIDTFYNIMLVYHYYLSHYDVIFKEIEEKLGTEINITR